MTNTPRIDDDILDYLKYHIDFGEYEKMKKVSVKYRKLFDLYPLLYSKSYDKLLYIKGITVELILKIIDSNIRKKYGFKKNKQIIKKLMKYEGLIGIAIYNNCSFVIEYLMDIIYNTSKRKFENIKNTMIDLYEKENLYYRNLDMFCSTLTIITKYFKNDTDYYYNENLELLYKLNIGLLLFIIVKKFSLYSYIIANVSQSSVINLFSMQNKKIDEYLVNICEEELYGDEKYFKKYYINTIVYLMKTLYIDMPTEFSASSLGMRDKSDEGNRMTRNIPCIYMITDGTDDIL
jgi:hypothetical protein